MAQLVLTELYNVFKCLLTLALYQTLMLPIRDCPYTLSLLSAQRAYALGIPPVVLHLAMFVF